MLEAAFLQVVPNVREPAAMTDDQRFEEIYNRFGQRMKSIAFNHLGTIAEAEDAKPFAVCGVRLHILRDGMRYDFARRVPLPVTEEFLLPDIS